MKLLVLGARGRTGSELVLQALAQHHDVTGVTRDAGQVKERREGLRWVFGDSTDRAFLQSAVQAQDAVLCAIGPTSPLELAATKLMRQTAAPLIDAMDTAGVKRLVMLSALGAGRSAAVAPPVIRLTFRTLLRGVGGDKAAAEEMINRSDLDYLLVYPPSLTKGPRTGSYRHDSELRLRGIPKVSRADVAEFMLAEAVTPTYHRQSAIIGQ